MTKGRKPAKWRAGRFLRLGLGSALVLALLILMVRVSLPGLVQLGGAHAAQHFLGLPLRIGNVDFSLWAGEMRLEDVRLEARSDADGPSEAAASGSDAPKALLQIQLVTLRWSWRDLLRRQVTLNSLVVEGPELRAMREADGQIAPLRNAQPRRKSPPVEAAPAGSSPWPIQIRSFALRSPKVIVAEATTGKNLLEFSLESFDLDEVSLKGGEVGLGAVAVQGPELRVRRELIRADTGPAAQAASTKSAPARAGWRIRQVDVRRAKFTWEGEKGPLDVLLTLEVSGVTAEEKRTFPLAMSVQIGDANVSLTGDAGIFSPFFQGNVTWNRLAFPPLLLAARPEWIEWLQSANSSGNLDLLADVAGLKGPPAIRLSGRTSLENFAASAPGENRISLGWKRLDLGIRKLVVPVSVEGQPPRPIVADVEHVNLENPWLVYAHPASVLELLKGGDEPFLADVSLSRLQLTGGTVEIRDTTVVATSHITALSVAVSDLHYPEATFGSLSIQAALPAAAQFSLEGSLQSGRTGDFAVSLQNLDLPPWNPYAKSSGISLDAGRASLQGKVGIHGEVIQVNNEIVLNRLGLSLHDPNSFAKQFGIPIDLALALLCDSSGDIRLKIPLRLDEKGTTVSKKEVAVSALKAAILGGISSPLKLLQAGFRPKDTPSSSVKPAADISAFSITPVQGVAGREEPAEGASKRIRGMVRLLAERPEIGLTLRGRTGPADLPVLAEEILVERAKIREKLPDVSDVGFLARRRISRYLAQRAKGESASLDEKDRELLRRFVAAVEVPADRLDGLARARAERVKSMLIEKGAPPAKLRVGDREADGDPGVVIALQLFPPDGKSESRPR